MIGQCTSCCHHNTRNGETAAAAALPEAEVKLIGCLLQAVYLLAYLLSTLHLPINSTARQRQTNDQLRCLVICPCYIINQNLLSFFITIEI